MKPRIGDVYNLKEPDYRFGTGKILVRVNSVIEEAEYNGERCWTIQGHVAMVQPNYFGAWQYREFLQIRAAALYQSRVEPAERGI
jgi:hypothetical protein